MNNDNITVVLNVEITGDCSEEAIAAILKKELDKQLLNHKPKFPKWEELGKIEGWYVEDSSELDSISDDSGGLLLDPCNKNVWPTKELAEASLALSQLAQLRDYVNDGWKPNWTVDYYKYCITIAEDKVGKQSWYYVQYFLAFKDSETRDGFLEAYRDLIEIAKPLL